jgi:hypothetical protein
VNDPIVLRDICKFIDDIRQATAGVRCRACPVRS